MIMAEFQSAYLHEKIEKKTYWTIMGENYTHILPEIQELLSSNVEYKSIQVTKDSCILGFVHISKIVL